MSARKALLPALALACAGAAADGVHWSTGLEYTSGDYGGSDTIEDLYVPVTGQVSFERTSFRLTVPYLSVTAPQGTIATDPDGEPVTGSGETHTKDGLGDIIAEMTVYDVVYSSRFGVALDLTGKIKFGTADQRDGLGTGEEDYTLQADLYKFYDRFTLFAMASYKYRGDPEGYDLKNVMLASVGAVLGSDRETRFGIAYDFRQSSLADGENLRDLSAFAARQISDRLQLQAYVIRGFSNSSPEWGAGLLLTIS